MVLGESLTQEGEQGINPAVLQMLWECERETMTDVLVSVSCASLGKEGRKTEPSASVFQGETECLSWCTL